jgi:hypothetical protein
LFIFRHRRPHHSNIVNEAEIMEKTEHLHVIEALVAAFYRHPYFPQFVVLSSEKQTSNF